jgi:AhpD family alkylhydroperoxidase
MGRIEPIAPNENQTRVNRILAATASTGTPDARLIRVLGKGELGARWLEFFSEVMTGGKLPHRLKELVRIRMSVVEECGYCSSVRSKLALSEGLTENVIGEMRDLETSEHITEREKAAVRYADRYKRNDVDSDEVFDDLREHFDDEEIIELGVLCSTVHGGGPFAISLQVLTWEQACEATPALPELKGATVAG